MIQQISEPQTLGSPAYHALLFFGVLMTWGLGLVPPGNSGANLFSARLLASLSRKRPDSVH